MLTILVSMLAGCLTTATEDSAPATDSDSGEVPAVDEPCPTEDPFCHPFSGLHWTDISAPEVYQGVNWLQASAACEDLGGRLPTITELRTTIQGCPITESAGECRVSTTCMDVETCGASCGGCDVVTDGSYSIFGDLAPVWSDTLALYTVPEIAWAVQFDYAIVYWTSQANPARYRCVQ